MKQTTNTNDDDKQLQALRALLFGDNGENLYQSLKPQAKQLVEEVISEALYERQSKDKSVLPVIRPIVEKSVESSVSEQSEKFTVILYPLVGSLVRKSVAAFLSHFIEKTNTLLENSLSVKGLKMRYRAWKQGIPFSQYLILQAYRYKVDTVLLIHRKTGTLLSCVTRDSQTDDNADLVSSMLTAINDFVSDSFADHQYTQQLDEIKTDDLSLYISHGPQALLVVASRGVIPAKDRLVFSKTIEQIHNSFLTELLTYEGANAPFVACEPLLQTCLVTQKNQDDSHKKKPWFGYASVALLFALLFWFCWIKIEARLLVTQLSKLNEQPGFVVTELDVRNINTVSLAILRDPDAISMSKWLADANIAPERIQIMERPYISLDKDIIIKKINALTLPLDINAKLTDEKNGHEKLSLIGQINWQGYQDFKSALNQISGIDRFDINFSELMIKNTALTNETQIDKIQTNKIKHSILKQKIAQLNLVQIDFKVNDTQLSVANQQNLLAAAAHIEEILLLSAELNTQTHIVLIGTSDTQDSTTKNLELSIERAKQVKQFLVSKGIRSDKLFTTGIGEVSFESENKSTRKVMFNVIYTPFEKNKAVSK